MSAKKPSELDRPTEPSAVSQHSAAEIAARESSKSKRKSKTTSPAAATPSPERSFADAQAAADADAAELLEQLKAVYIARLQQQLGEGVNGLEQFRRDTKARFAAAAEQYQLSAATPDALPTAR